MEELFARKKYLGNILGHHILPKDCLHLSQRPSEETDNNINTSRLCSTYAKANS